MTFHPKGSKDWGDPKKNACLKYIFICLLVKFFIAGLEWFLLHTDWDEKKKRVINSVGQECKKSKTPNEIHLKYSTQWKQMQIKKEMVKGAVTIFLESFTDDIFLAPESQPRVGSGCYLHGVGLICFQILQREAGAIGR